MELSQHLLLSFPIEVLAGITSYFEARDLARLWICGCKQLQEALGSRGGAKVFRLKQDWFYVSSWPPLLRNFPQLTELSFLDASLVQTPHLLETSSTLRKLELNFDKSLTYFLEALADGPSHFAHLETLYIDDPLGAIEFEPFSRLKTVSSLTSLDLSAPVYAGSILDFLPPNLVSLIYNTDRIGTMDFNFPRSLESFSCWLGDSCERFGDFADLPQGLRKFIFNSEIYSFPPSEIEKLPRGLTYLITAIAGSNPVEVLKALPPLIQTFIHNSLHETYDMETCKHLPRSITHTNVIPDVTMENVALLPPNIVHARVKSSELAIIPKLPPKLVELYFEGELTATIPTEPIALPNTLTKFNCVSSLMLERCILPESLLIVVSARTRFPTAQAQRLPPTLNSLNISSCDLECLPHLPRGLKSFHTGPIGDDAVLQADSVAAFPRALNSLTFGVKQLEPLAMSNFPVNLA